jgi:cell division protease FtsH
LGPLTFGKKEEQIFLGREIAQHRDYSEETARKIDVEVKKLILESYEQARSLLGENLEKLHRLAQTLLEKETLDGETIDRIIREEPPAVAGETNKDEHPTANIERPTSNIGM